MLCSRRASGRSTTPARSCSAPTGTTSRPSTTTEAERVDESAHRMDHRPHPRIVRGVGVHGGAAVIGGLGAQFVMPGLVAVGLTQPVRGAVDAGAGRGGIGRRDADRAGPELPSRRRRRGHRAARRQAAHQRPDRRRARGPTRYRGARRGARARGGRIAPPPRSGGGAGVRTTGASGSCRSSCEPAPLGAAADPLKTPAPNEAGG